MTFDEWWYKYGIEIDIPKNEACVIWMAALNNAEALKPSHNSAMDAIAALRDLYSAAEWALRDGLLPGAFSDKVMDRAKDVLKRHQ
jgi:hypothetical protein